MKFYKNQTVSISVTQPLTSTLKGTIIRTTKTKLVVDIHNHKITDFRRSDLSSMTDHKIFKATIQE